MPVRKAIANVSNRCMICNVCKSTESSALGPIDDLLFTYFEQDDKENYPDYLLTQGVSRELLHYDVKAQGAKTDVLLDCGATRDYADETNMRKLGFSLVPLEESFEVKLANGARIPCKYVIKRIKIKFKQFSHEADLFVLDLKGEHNIILGQTFLKARNPDINWKTGTMTMRKTHQSHQDPEDSVDSITAILSKKCKVTLSTLKDDTLMEEVPTAFDTDILSGLDDEDRLHEHFRTYDQDYEDAFIDGGEFKKIYKRNLRQQQQERRRKPHREVSLDGDAFCIWIRNAGEKILVLNNAGEQLMEVETIPQEDTGESLTDALQKQLSREVYDKWASVMKPYPPKGVPPVRWPGVELRIED